LKLVLKQVETSIYSSSSSSSSSNSATLTNTQSVLDLESFNAEMRNYRAGDLLPKIVL